MLLRNNSSGNENKDQLELTPAIALPVSARGPALTQKVSKKGGVGGPVALATGYENTYPLPNRPE